MLRALTSRPNINSRPFCFSILKYANDFIRHKFTTGTIYPELT
jgi:hypothetical protein